MSKIDIARALKDQTYFNSLSEEDKAKVRQANPVGDPNLNDQDLDSVSGGLGGGVHPDSTTTTTNLQSCTCGGTSPGIRNPGSSFAANSPSDCGCAC